MDKKFELRLFEFENFNLPENHFDQIYNILDSAKKELELKKQEYIESLKDIEYLCIEVVEPMFFVEEGQIPMAKAMGLSCEGQGQLAD
jgi:hypothetical protein